MSSNRVFRWIVGLALGVGAIGIFVVLYQRSTPVDFRHHAEAVEAIRDLQGRSETLQQQVLAVRFGLLRQYDAITDEQHAMEVLVDRIDSRTSRALGSSPVPKELSALRTALEERRQLVESFKSQASVLRNSLYYLPVAGADLTKQLARYDELDAADEITAEINALTNATLVYNLLGGRGTKSDMVTKFEGARALTEDLPEDSRGDFELFLRHAEIVGEQLGRVDSLLQDIRGRSVEGALARLSRSYESRVAGRMEEANDYRRALYGWSVFLMLLVVFAGYKLRQVYVHQDRLVKERTKELNDAVEELWGEMELARKIQMALVPSSPSLAGFDIAAKMQPADQVGGDYYDVFRAGDTDWILIGDVSGHGVPSGLVMMMCQTAMRTAIGANPNMEPHYLLTLVNQSLTENIGRLGEDRYVTCTAIAHRQDGHLRFSGMHQDLIIYRARERKVERIEARGMWLGLTPDISGLQETWETHLSPGDSLLLYTDGLTEATQDGEMLDLDNLEALLEKHGHDSADVILSEIIGSLSNAEIHDDVAVVVLKRGEQSVLIDAAE